MRLRLACSLALVFGLAGCPGPAAENDAGVVPNDAFVPGNDAFVVPNDTGMPGNDAFVAPMDTGMGNDAFVVPNDTGTTTADAGSDAGTMAGCGTARPTLPMTGTEGLVIARDGTIYYSRSGGVARLASDGTIDANWLRIPGAGTIWGLALDATNTHLYVCDVDNDQVRDVTNLTTTPTQTMLAAVSSPNGITIGPDGAIYVSSFGSSGQVRRIDPSNGMTTTVTTSSINGADGVAFTNDGRLLVTAYGPGTVVALTLDASHREMSRATVATMVPNADGVAVDENGVIYVGGNEYVWRIGAGGTPDMTLQMGRSGTANLEWGAGALNCQDLYVATGSRLTRIPLTVRQRAVPWH